MKPDYRYLGIAAGLLVLAGCAATSTPSLQRPSPAAAQTSADPALAETYRAMGSDLVKKGELRKAILWLEVASALDPSDPKTPLLVENLKKQSQALSEKHFSEGVRRFTENEYVEARKAFLLALYYDPEKTEALPYLKERIPGEDVLEYRVREGDTLQQVASQIYYDPGKDFVIASYNDLNRDAALTPGTVLKLPVIDFIDPSRWVDTEGYFTGISTAEELMPPSGRDVRPSPGTESKPKPLLAALPPPGTPKPSVDERSPLDKELIHAERLFKANRFLEAIPASEKILAQDSTNPRAREILNESALQVGKRMLASKNYDQAVAVFQKADPGYKDIAVSRTVAEKSMADFHYLAGVRFFINEELEKAIREWERTLALNPRHHKASRDLENARMILKRLKEIQ